jgi:hypothetical protein|eukprot:7382258-Prymnesium_polylepis.1
MSLASRPPSSLARFRALLRSKERDVYEPNGQDGRSCQYLAFADQLQRKGCACDAEALEVAMLDWLARHHDDVTIGHTRGDMGHVEVISDKWTAAEFNGVMARTAWGDHFTLGALCAVVRELHGMRACVKVQHLSGQIDCVAEPNTDAVYCDVTLELAYTGNHYLSIVPLECASPEPAPCHVCLVV